MAKANPIQTNFTAGEFTPKAKGRVDVQRYANAAAAIRNCFVQLQGGAKRRSGTVFVSEVANSSNQTRLLEFVFNQTQAFILEFGNNTIRFYYQNQLVLVSSTPYSISSPYSSSDLAQLKYCQSADDVFLFHPNYPPYVLARASNTSWSINLVTFTDGPYLPVAYSDPNTDTTGAGLTLTASGVASTITVTASAPLFVSTDVGRHIRIMTTAKWGWGVISVFGSSTSVSVALQNALDGSGSATQQWRLGAFCPTLGYPSVGTFHQQRFVLAAPPSQPQTVFFSMTSNLYTFSPTDMYNPSNSASGAEVLDNSGFGYSLASSRQNNIVWLQSSQVLLLGTTSSCWRVEPNDYTNALTPTNATLTTQASWGASQTCRVNRLNYEVFFVHVSGREVFRLFYQFQVSSFVAASVSVLSEHLLREGGSVIDVAYQSQPTPMLWHLRNDGLIAGLTYTADEQVSAWHLHQIAGAYSGGAAVVESVAVIPTQDGTQDQLWMVVKRTINGSTKRYVEYLAVPYESSDTTQPNSVFVDAAAQWLASSGPGTHITGFSHLVGQTVQVLADGSQQPDCVVASDGSIDIQIAASNVIAGLAYDQNTYISTLPYEAGGGSGTSQGKKKRTHRVTARFLETAGAQASQFGLEWQDFPIQNITSGPPPLFTGDIRVPTDFSTDTEETFTVRAKGPYPFTLLALMPEEMVNQ